MIDKEKTELGIEKKVISLDKKDNDQSKKKKIREKDRKNRREEKQREETGKEKRRERKRVEPILHNISPIYSIRLTEGKVDR